MRVPVPTTQWQLRWPKNHRLRAARLASARTYFKTPEAAAVQCEIPFAKSPCLTAPKLWNQVHSLDHLLIQNSGDYFCWNIDTGSPWIVLFLQPQGTVLLRKPYYSGTDLVLKSWFMTFGFSKSPFFAHFQAILIFESKKVIIRFILKHLLSYLSQILTSWY